MNSRNLLREARELETLKVLRLPYPWGQAVLIYFFRKVAYPREIKSSLYATALALLPVTLTLFGTLTLNVSMDEFSWLRAYEMWGNGEEGRAWLITFCLYCLLVFAVLGLKLMTDKYTRSLLLPKDEAARMREAEVEAENAADKAKKARRAWTKSWTAVGKARVMTWAGSWTKANIAQAKKARAKAWAEFLKARDKSWVKSWTEAKRMEYRAGTCFLLLVFLGFASSFTSLKGVTPYSQLAGTLTFAILIAIISQRGLSLQKKYRAKAEEKPVEVQEWMYVVASFLTLVWLIWILFSWPFPTELPSSTDTLAYFYPTSLR